MELNRRSVPATIAHTNAYLGIGMRAGRNRSNKQQKMRINKAVKRVGCVARTLKINRKAKRLAVKGVNFVQNYGSTVLGTGKGPTAK